MRPLLALALAALLMPAVSGHAQTQADDDRRQQQALLAALPASATPVAAGGSAEDSAARYWQAVIAGEDVTVTGDSDRQLLLTLLQQRSAQGQWQATQRLAELMLGLRADAAAVFPVAQDAEAATLLRRKAYGLDGREAWAVELLGRLYLAGRGVPRDEEEAWRLFSQCAGTPEGAAGEDLDAVRRLCQARQALLLERGWGTAADAKKAAALRAGASTAEPSVATPDAPPAATTTVTAVATASPPAGERLYLERFDQPGDWPADTDLLKASVSGGLLRVARSGARNREAVLVNEVRLPATAAWRASVDVRFGAGDANDSLRRGGLTVAGPFGDSLRVWLDPDGDVLVQHYNRNGQVAATPLQFVRAAAARRGEGASNTLTLVRDDGYFRVLVNDTPVGRTPPLDLSPRFLGVISASAQPFVLEFDNLRLERTGRDSRLARLLNRQGTPGALDLCIDNFSRGKDQAAGWWTGNNGLIRATLKDGRYLVKGLQGDKESVVNCSARTTPRSTLGGSSGYQFSATVEKLAGEDGWGSGIVLYGRKGARDKQQPQILFKASETLINVVLVSGNGGYNDLLRATRSRSLTGRKDELNMTVLADGRLLLFANGELQATLPMPPRFELDDVGLVVGGPIEVAFDDVYAREI